MNPILFDFGFIEIYWYSIFILFAILTGSSIFYYFLKAKKFSDLDITNMLFYAIIFGIIGARIYYVLFNLDYYFTYPIEILEVWNGGLAIHGGIIAGLITIFVYCKKHHLNFFKVTDSASIGVIIAQAIGRWGNFFNSEAHGGVTTLEHLKSLHLPSFIIKGMYIDGNYYLPTFLYESLWNVLGFIILFLIYKKYKKLKVGQITGLYFMWYSVGRFFIEGMRTDSLMISSIAVILFLIMFACFILFVLYKNNRIINKKYFLIGSSISIFIGIVFIIFFSRSFGNLRVAKFISLILFCIGLFLVVYNNKDTRMKRLERKDGVL